MPNKPNKKILNLLESLQEGEGELWKKDKGGSIILTRTGRAAMNLATLSVSGLAVPITEKCPKEKFMGLIEKMQEATLCAA